MRSFIVFIATYSILIGSSVVIDAADGTCPEGAKSASLTLKRKLFCDYDRSVRPVKLDTNATEVEIHMWLKFLLFHEDWNTLDVHSWMIWSWKDEHLKWDKQDYDDLDTMSVLSSQIWVPDIALYTSADMSEVTPEMSTTQCHIDHGGTVICVSPTVHSAQCNADITKWPFDTHNCSMRIGSWTNTGNVINLTLNNKGLTVIEYTPNRDWELISSNASLHRPQYRNTTYPFASYSFILKRHSGGPAATVFIPALVLATLTLVIFWLDASSSERLAVICFNILCHCIYLQYLGVHLPSNGDKYPVILLFYRDSLLMAAVSLIITLVVRRMNAASSPPPVWIVTVTNGVLALPPGQVLLLGGVDPKGVAAAMETGDTEDGTGLVAESPESKRWRLFGTLIDRGSFIFFFLTFIILLTAFVP